MNQPKQLLADLQSTPPQFALAINKVGVNGLVFRLRLKDRQNGIQEVTATASLAVNLPEAHRGTHMSRFVEVLDAWQEELGCQSVRHLLENLLSRLGSQTAYAELRFDYLMPRGAPISGITANLSYPCTVCATLSGNDLTFDLEIAIPVMTVCPCSLAISETGAHCQRAIVRLQVSIDSFVWLEDLIAIAEGAGSSPVYPLLKREDEKFVTEYAFSRPAFVEDVARAIAINLTQIPQVRKYAVSVESMESIHNHNAFAVIGPCHI